MYVYIYIHVYVEREGEREKEKEKKIKRKGGLRQKHGSFSICFFYKSTTCRCYFSNNFIDLFHIALS